MRTSKSPRLVLQVAHEAAREALPAYRHRFSPKKFTQHQLLACLVLKEFLRVDYRGLAAYLEDAPALREEIGLKAVPHYFYCNRLFVTAVAGPRIVSRRENGWPGRESPRIRAAREVPTKGSAWASGSGPRGS